jgi:hypothetical protein
MNDDEALANSILNKALSTREKKEQRERTPKSNHNLFPIALNVKVPFIQPKCITKDYPNRHVLEPTNCQKQF